jgi:hypothetical protein
MEAQVFEKQAVMNEILKYYSNLNEQNLTKLVELTNQQKIGYVSLKGYSSELSKGTEIADQLINVGVNYKKALESDKVTFDNVDLSTIDVNKFDYNYINTGDLTLVEYKKAITESLPQALEELQGDKRKRKSNDIKINSILYFNTNTLKLSIVGKSESKVVETKGEFKVVKSKPLTVAKRLIEQQVNGKTQKLRRFTIENFVGSVKLLGETIEIE